MACLAACVACTSVDKAPAAVGDADASDPAADTDSVTTPGDSDEPSGGDVTPDTDADGDLEDTPSPVDTDLPPTVPTWCPAPTAIVPLGSTADADIDGLLYQMRLCWEFDVLHVELRKTVLNDDLSARCSSLTWWDGEASSGTPGAYAEWETVAWGGVVVHGSCVPTWPYQESTAVTEPLTTLYPSAGSSWPGFDVWLPWTEDPNAGWTSIMSPDVDDMTSVYSATPDGGQIDITAWRNVPAP